MVSAATGNQDDTSLIRPLQIASIDYSEILGPLEIREYINSASARNNNDEGLLGVTMAETFLARPGQITRLQIFALTAVAFILVITLGIWLANRLTRPLLRVVAASAEVVVNGRAAGIKVAPPWRLNLTSLVKTGENRIETLACNTLANHYVTIPTHYRGSTVSGLLGPVRLEVMDP